MASKTIKYTLFERQVKLGKNAGKVMQIARATGRRRVNFRSFCETVARSTTFNAQEVQAVINYATAIARDMVADGDIVEFGDLGTLLPSLKSKAVEVGEKFNPNIHIEKSLVVFRPSKDYFTLPRASYERAQPTEKKVKK